MKRGQPPQRRTELRRTELRRSAGPKRPASSGLTRSGPIAPVSATRRSERDERLDVTAAAIAADGDRCALWWLADPALAARAGIAPTECFGDLVAHEVAHRSVKPGSHLDRDLTIALCVGHNGWEDVQTNTVAELAGARVSSWWVDRHGAEAVAGELRRIRRARERGLDPGPPFWQV